MKKFMDKDFLLTTKTAREIYKKGAEKTPIFDWHCHLSPKEIYENKGYQIYIKEQNLSNEEFYNNVTQFDILINSTNKESEILTIEEVVLANYEELIKRKSN